MGCCALNGNKIIRSNNHSNYQPTVGIVEKLKEKRRELEDFVNSYNADCANCQENVSQSVDEIVCSGEFDIIRDNKSSTSNKEVNCRLQNHVFKWNNTHKCLQYNKVKRLNYLIDDPYANKKLNTNPESSVFMRKKNRKVIRTPKFGFGINRLSTEEINELQLVISPLSQNLKYENGDVSYDESNDNNQAKSIHKLSFGEIKLIQGSMANTESTLNSSEQGSDYKPFQNKYRNSAFLSNIKIEIISSNFDDSGSSKTDIQLCRKLSNSSPCQQKFSIDSVLRARTQEVSENLSKVLSRCRNSTKSNN